MAEKSSKIVLSVDPGFDSSKVTYEGGETFKIPKEVVEVTGMSGLFIGAKSNDYIKVSYIEGKEHLVGAYAARFLNEAQQDERAGANEKATIADTYATFETTDKEIAIMTSAAVALINMAKEGGKGLVLTKNSDGSFDLSCDKADVYISIALPHDAVGTAWGYIKKYIFEEKKFTVELADGIYNVNIKVTDAYGLSQVVVALVGAISDDNGQIDMNGSYLGKDSLPALIIDGGYKTLGKFLFTTVMSVDGGESNQDYAMMNIHEKVAEKLIEEYNRKEMNSRKVKRIMEESGEIPYIKEDGSAGMVDVKALVNEEIEVTCNTMIKEFEEKYNNLLDIKMVLVTGGTGAAYYPIIKKILAGKPWIKVVLTDYEFYGRNISPEYAISVGAFKAAKNKSSR